MTVIDDRDAALLALLQTLDARGYDFVTPTPLSHARVLARSAHASPDSLRDIFGWNRAFRVADLDPGLQALMQRADMLVRSGDLYTCRYRVARCEGLLFLHSAFPTLAADSVFFGPDSYRFARWARAESATAAPFTSLIDLGAGAGVGGLTLARRYPGARVRLVDLNAEALRLARINAAAADLTVETEAISAMDVAWSCATAIIANPPYMADDGGRLYRDGGAMRGAAVSVDWTRAVATRLRPGDVFFLYTGVAVVSGADPLRAALQEIATAAGCSLRYDEIDPDVWGEELARASFHDVDRIAVIGAVIQRAP